MRDASAVNGAAASVARSERREKDMAFPIDFPAVFSGDATMARGIETRNSRRAKFSKFNAGKLMSDAEWWLLWEKWCVRAVEYAKR